MFSLLAPRFFISRTTLVSADLSSWKQVLYWPPSSSRMASVFSSRISCANCVSVMLLVPRETLMLDRGRRKLLTEAENNCLNLVSDLSQNLSPRSQVGTVPPNQSQDRLGRSQWYCLEDTFLSEGSVQQRTHCNSLGVLPLDWPPVGDQGQSRRPRTVHSR